MIEWLFIISMILLTWTFIGYPLFLLILSKFIQKEKSENIMLLGKKLKDKKNHKMSNIKRKEKEIYNHKRGIGKVEYGSWWDKELYAYLESFRFKKIWQWYNIYLKNKDYLVLGCGNGEDIKDFKEKPRKVIGIDISLRLISGAKVKFKRHEFIICDAEELPFKNESFNVIFAKSILHHFATS